MSRFQRKPEWTIPLTYFAISTIWILFSDMLLFDYLAPYVSLQTLSMIKGWVFVSFTALLLLLFLRRQFSAYRRRHREREEVLSQLRMHIDRMPIGYIVTDREFRFQYLNPAAEKMFGFSSDELKGKSPYGSIIPESSNAFVEDIRRSWMEGNPEPHGKNVNLTKSGRTIVCEWLNTPIFDDHGTFDHLISMVQDVTELEHAVDSLRRSEERYRALMEDLPALVCEFTTDSTLTYVNRAYAEYFSTTPGELIGKRFLDFLSEEAAAEVRKTYMSLTPSYPSYTYSHSVQLRGKEVIHQWTDRAFFDDDGKIVRFQAVGFDMTERVRAEEALRASEERYRILIERANDGILLIKDGVFVSCNQSAARMLRYEPQDIIGKHPADISPPTQPDGVPSEAKARSLMRASAVGTRNVFDWIHLRRSGEQAVIEVSLSRVDISEQPMLLCFWRDITERKQAEREIADSRERLRALAERLDEVREEERLHLSREIHDGLGQSLTALKIDLTLLQRILRTGVMRDNDDREWTECDVREVGEAIESMNSLLRQTIDQVRQIAWEMRPGMLDQLGLPDALRQYVRDMSERSGLTLHEEIEDLQTMPSNRSSLALYRIVQEALTNTVRHAGAQTIWLRLRAEGPRLRLEIADDGRGIPAQAPGVNGGIGLSSMRERAESLGGTCTIHSVEGGGTRIIVDVPN